MANTKLKELPTFELESEKLSQGYKFIAGTDEVGRGPLAGPVVAAAVILNPKDIPEGLNDSKKLSKKKREELYEIIKEKAIACDVGLISPSEIDEINILQASFKAMRVAIEKLKVTPDFVLVDGNKEIPRLFIDQEAIVKGDGKSQSIAAASILAKVYRDRIMCAYHERHPEYGFDSNVGYGSKGHIDAIREFGFLSIHRKSFKVKL